MKSLFGFLNKNPPWGRISRKWNPFLDFTFDGKKSKIRISKSKSGFPNRTQPKENSSSLVYVLHKTWSFFTSKSCRDGREMFCFIISLLPFRRCRCRRRCYGSLEARETGTNFSVSIKTQITLVSAELLWSLYCPTIDWPSDRVCD